MRPYYHDLMIHGMPRNDKGKKTPSFLAPAVTMIPKGRRTPKPPRIS
jgi:hypothetical protein